MRTSKSFGSRRPVEDSGSDVFRASVMFGGRFHDGSRASAGGIANTAVPKLNVGTDDTPHSRA